MSCIPLCFASCIRSASFRCSFVSIRSVSFCFASVFSLHRFAVFAIIVPLRSIHFNVNRLELISSSFLVDFGAHFEPREVLEGAWAGQRCPQITPEAVLGPFGQTIVNLMVGKWHFQKNDVKNTPIFAGATKWSSRLHESAIFNL